MQAFTHECFAPVTEAVWLAADVMAAGPDFVEEAFVTCRDGKMKKLNSGRELKSSNYCRWWHHHQGATHVECLWTWEATVDCWEVGVDDGVGRLWRTSSGGGTGRTTGEELDGSLLTSRTSMGPVELLRRIWYFLCPLTTWTACGNERLETKWQLDGGEKQNKIPQIWLTDSGTGTSSCVPMGARIARSVSPGESGEGGSQWGTKATLRCAKLPETD